MNEGSTTDTAGCSPRDALVAARQTAVRSIRAGKPHRTPYGYSGLGDWQDVRLPRMVTVWSGRAATASRARRRRSGGGMDAIVQFRETAEAHGLVDPL